MEDEDYNLYVPPVVPEVPENPAQGEEQPLPKLTKTQKNNLRRKAKAKAKASILRSDTPIPQQASEPLVQEDVKEQEAAPQDFVKVKRKKSRKVKKEEPATQTTPQSHFEIIQEEEEPVERQEPPSGVIIEEVTQPEEASVQSVQAKPGKVVPRGADRSVRVVVTRKDKTTTYSPDTD